MLKGFDRTSLIAEILEIFAVVDFNCMIKHEVLIVSSIIFIFILFGVHGGVYVPTVIFRLFPWRVCVCARGSVFFLSVLNGECGRDRMVRRVTRCLHVIIII